MQILVIIVTLISSAQTLKTLPDLIAEASINTKTFTDRTCVEWCDKHDEEDCKSSVWILKTMKCYALRIEFDATKVNFNDHQFIWLPRNTTHYRVDMIIKSDFHSTCSDTTGNGMAPIVSFTIKFKNDDTILVKNFTVSDGFPKRITNVFLEKSLADNGIKSIKFVLIENVNVCPSKKMEIVKRPIHCASGHCQKSNVLLACNANDNTELTVDDSSESTYYNVNENRLRLTIYGADIEKCKAVINKITFYAEHQDICTHSLQIELNGKFSHTHKDLLCQTQIMKQKINAILIEAKDSKIEDCINFVTVEDKWLNYQSKFICNENCTDQLRGNSITLTTAKIYSYADCCLTLTFRLGHNGQIDLHSISIVTYSNGTYDEWLGNINNQFTRTLRGTCASYEEIKEVYIRKNSGMNKITLTDVTIANGNSWKIQFKANYEDMNELEMTDSAPNLRLRNYIVLN